MAPAIDWSQTRHIKGGLQLIILRGYATEEIIVLYKQAKVIVDFYLPGFERAVQEAALYGVVPLVSSEHNGNPVFGADDFTFLKTGCDYGDKSGTRTHFKCDNIPLNKLLVFDPAAIQEVANKIQYIVNNYDEIITHPQLLQFRADVLALPDRIPIVVDKLMKGTNVTVVLIPCSEKEEALVFVLVLTLLHHAPLISIEVS